MAPEEWAELEREVLAASERTGRAGEVLIDLGATDPGSEGPTMWSRAWFEEGILPAREVLDDG